jgi:dipeptidyl aminopeptidase/acylaminoacyl peptidase
VGAAVAANATAANASAEVQTRPFALADLANVVTISAPRIDTERNRENEENDLIDVATGSRRALTFGRSELASPKCSPDGGRIGFIADGGRGENARPYSMSCCSDGGDPQMNTQAPDGVDQFAWRPDGRTLAFVAVDAAPKKSGAQRFIDAYEVCNGSNLRPGAARSFRVWLQPLGVAHRRPRRCAGRQRFLVRILPRAARLG